MKRAWVRWSLRLALPVMLAAVWVGLREPKMVLHHQPDERPRPGRPVVTWQVWAGTAAIHVIRNTHVFDSRLGSDNHAVDIALYSPDDALDIVWIDHGFGMLERRGYRRLCWPSYYAAAGSHHSIAVPWWLLMMVSALPAGVGVVRDVRRRRRRLRGMCPSCGYDLCATPERCPECGEATAAGEG
jgi:hypothetical protein